MDIEGKFDGFDPIQPQWKKNIVSQDMSYAVTYSKEDKSICGWSAVEEKGQLEFDVQIKFDLYYVEELILYNEILLFRYYERDDHSNTYKVCKLLLLFKYAKKLFHTFRV